LEFLGYTVLLASNGDGFKGFESDIKISPYNSKYLGKILNVIYFIINIRKFTGYDVVQFISPFVFPYYYHYLGLPKLVYWLNRKKIYYACGTDPAFLSSSRKFSYFPFDDKNSSEYPNYNKKNKYKIYNNFLKNIDLIIPAMYEYFVGYADNPKVVNPIPLPCTNFYTKKIKKTEKINILFGITRKNFKGSDQILKALDSIKIKYNNKLIIKIVEKVPFNEYSKMLDEADILIDQCKSYSYGMNAICAMERGVIVLSGNEKIAMDYLGIQDSAVVNITPSSEHIESILSSLIDCGADNIYHKKLSSLEYVKKYHNAVTIANKFNKSYNNILK
jgi:hypothetical protein